MQGSPIAYSGNIQTSNTFDKPPIVFGRSRAAESQVYADGTYGLHYGPKSIYQIPWPFPVFSTTDPPNEDRTFVDPGRVQMKFRDSGAIQDKEVIFIGGVVPTSGGIPIFNPHKVQYKFKRPYSKFR